MVDLAAGRDHDEVGRDLGPEAAIEVLRHRLAQGRDAGRVGIAVLAVAQRLDRRFDDVRGRFEIRLADAEIDDVAPFALQFGRLREHRESVLLAHAREGGIDWNDEENLRRRRPLLAKAWPPGKQKARAGLADRAPAAFAERKE